jgi:peptidoglycan/LPS O-acetylase OafA/YrhL
MIYRNDIQGLRALAILMVVGAHFAIPGLDWGFAGVDIFFVISGYLITQFIYVEYAETGNFNYLNFYARRFRRLLPALTLMIAVTLFAGHFLLSPAEQAKAAKIAPFASVWLSNFYFSFASINYFDAPLQDSLFLHTWSLGVEEQFYLFWPVFLIAIVNELKKSTDTVHRKGLFFALSIFIAASLIGCIVLSYGRPTWAYYMMPTRLWQFALGGAGFFISQQLAKSPKNQYRGFKNAIPFMGLALLVLSGLLLSPDKIYPGYLVLFPTCAALCFLINGEVSPTSKITKLLGVFPMRFLGDISYSLYLWHWPVWVLSSLFITDNAQRLLIAIPLTLILSIVSYHLCEAPIRRSNFFRSRTKLTIAIAVTCMLLMVTVSGLLLEAARKSSRTPEISFYEKIRDHKPWIYSYGCDKWFFSAEVAPCVYGPKTATHIAAIFGDSVGAQWIPAIQAIYNDPEWKIIVYTKSACPMLDEKFFYRRLGREYIECEIWRDNAASQLRELHPDVVFMGSAINTYSETQWTKGTQRLLDKFSNASGQIFIFRSTPVLPYNAIDCLTRKKWVSQYIDISGLCEPKVNDTYSEQVFSWQKNAIKPYQNVKLLDLNEAICPKGICVLERDAQVLYRDNQHLSVAFVESLTGYLYQSMTE